METQTSHHFQIIGLSKPLVGKLVSNRGGGLRKVLAAHKRAVAAALHPDNNPAVNDIDVGIINNAFSELLARSDEELLASAQAYIQPNALSASMQSGSNFLASLDRDKHKETEDELLRLRQTVAALRKLLETYRPERIVGLLDLIRQGALRSRMRQESIHSTCGRAFVTQEKALRDELDKKADPTNPTWIFELSCTIYVIRTDGMLVRKRVARKVAVPKSLSKQAVLDQWLIDIGNEVKELKISATISWEEVGYFLGALDQSEEPLEEEITKPSNYSVNYVLNIMERLLARELLAGYKSHSQGYLLAFKPFRSRYRLGVATGYNLKQVRVNLLRAYQIPV